MTLPSEEYIEVLQDLVTLIYYDTLLHFTEVFKKVKQTYSSVKFGWLKHVINSIQTQ